MDVQRLQRAMRRRVLLLRSESLLLFQLLRQLQLLRPLHLPQHCGVAVCDWDEQTDTCVRCIMTCEPRAAPA